MNKIFGFFEAERNLSEKIGHLTGLKSINNIGFTENTINHHAADYFILFDGIIYNSEMLANNYSLSVSNDAELALELFRKNQEKGIKAIDGSFVLVIVSPDRVNIFRDRHGTRGQLYYTSNCFSNTLPILKSISPDAFIPDYRGVTSFLQRGYIPSPLTALEGVSKLGAGCYLQYRDGKIETHNLYNYDEFVPDLTINEDEAVNVYEDLHGKAIKKRISGHNKVGILLSGGYDSGGNIYKLRNIFDGEIEGFSIGFNDNPWTEVPLANILANEFGAQFHSYNIDGSEITFLPQIVRATGDPFQEGGLLVNYCAMQMASENNTQVVLGGDGNDQFFGTSGKELALSMYLQNTILSLGSSLASSICNSALLSGSDQAFRLNFHLGKVNEILKPDSFGFTPTEQKHLIKKELYTHFDLFGEKSPNFNNFDELYLYRNYHVDIQQVINEVILFKASRMAEYWNQNIVFPYADLDIYDFLKKLPRELKCKGSPKDLIKSKGVAKFLHKKYLKPLLPNDITDRKKQGGFAPLPVFFKDHKRRSAICNFIRNSSFSSNALNPIELERFFKTYSRIADQPTGWFWQKQVFAFKLMNLLTMAVWWDLTIEDKKYNSLLDFDI